MFDIFIKKIKELSNGHFSFDNQKVLTGPDTDVLIYEAKMTRDTRLAYQIDCVPEFESTVIIKLFGIYTHAQLDKRFWDGVGYQLGRKGKEYRTRCTLDRITSNVGEHAHIILPKIFPPLREVPVESPSSRLPDLHKDDLEKVCAHFRVSLLLEKYVTFSQVRNILTDLKLGILADADVSHVFDVSAMEKKIIEHPFSCYVIGRSGTGKTTTMLFKMLGIERSFQLMQNDAMHRPRQMFVTQSRVLAEKVKEFFMKLHESLLSADKSPEEIKAIVAARQARQARGLVDQDEEIDWRGDLPKRFSDLKDEHFPMFVTYHQVGLILDGLRQHCVQHSHEALSSPGSRQDRAAFVSYQTFLSSYWPHFPQHLTKGLDPSLLFAEFIGVLKGSEATLNGANTYLNQEQYFDLSHRSQGTFTTQRETVYMLFQDYCKMKRERGDYDAADRTHAILRRLRKGVPGQLIDFVYIDEAQDNLLIDALVLRTICSNPDTGLFWAGDTAQTISMGSAFRFDDLKAFLYRIEVRYGRPRKRQQPQPHLFQLAVNYRSHAGIVNCAHSIIELVTQFWPHAIDKLAPERGIIEGLKPVFFTGWDDDTVRYEQFLFGGSGSPVDFGATQCIIVRDDDARKRLRAQVGDRGIIFIVYESKGLEFNDVLLYNFFADATVDMAQWRVVLNALSETQEDKLKAPTFNDARHNGVCRDLKFLYVAVTRARKNLWIVDSSAKGKPMQVYWASKNQIQICTPGSDVPRLAVSSTPEEWAKTALTLFNKKRYSQAMHCYERAQMHRERAITYAYYLRERARSTPANLRDNSPSREAAFKAAADAFWDSAKSTVLEKRAYFRISAGCYAESGNNTKAAEAYIQAAEYTLAAQYYRKEGMFDEAVNVIESHRQEMDHTIADSIYNISRLEYLRARKLKRARELFESDEEALEFMDDYGLDVVQTIYLVELKRFSEAAEIHLAEGRTFDAIKTFLQDKDNLNSVRSACQCLLDALWRGLPLGLTPESAIARRNATLQELIRMAHEFSIDDLDERRRDELFMFQAIVANDSAKLLELGHRFHRRHGNRAAALRCLDHVFTDFPELLGASAAEITTSLQHFLLYVQWLQRYAFADNPCDDKDIQRLLGFQNSTQDFFLVFNDTHLRSLCNNHKTPSLRSTQKGVQVLRVGLERIIKGILRERLHRKVREENKLCYRLRALRPCIGYTVYGRCIQMESGQCSREHLDTKDDKNDAYNQRVRAILQQILIYHTIYYIEPLYERDEQRRLISYWLRRLYETLNPSVCKLGSSTDLNRLTIPEFEDALHAIRCWILDWLRHLQPFGSTFLSSFIGAVSLYAAFHPTHASRHVPRLDCVRVTRPGTLMRQGVTGAVYVVHDLLAFMNNCTRTALTQGTLFIDHILENHVPIDAGDICNIVDHLCGLLILSYRSQTGINLHDVILPKSWLLRLTSSFDKLEGREIRFVDLYLRSMAQLLERMYMAGIRAEHLLFENINIASTDQQIRNTFVAARICKCFKLLHPSAGISKSLIPSSIGAPCVSSPLRSSHSFVRYANARLWDDLAHELRQYSSNDTSFDEIIHIHKAEVTSQQSLALPDVRHLIYDRIEDIPSLLDAGATSLPTPTLRREGTESMRAHQINWTARPKVGTPAKLANISHNDTLAPQDEATAIVVEDRSSTPDAIYDAAPEDTDAEAVAAAPDDGDVEYEFDDMDAALSAEDDQARAAAIQPTEEELGAALTLLTVYRAFVHRRAQQERRRTPITTHAIRRRVTAEFETAAKTMEWPHRTYRMIFLGPLPHAVVCLELLHGHLFEAKGNAKRRLVMAIHHDLEAVGARLTEIKQLLKETKRLREALKPAADLHKRRDIEELRKRVAEVSELAQRVPKTDWREDLALAYKGIVQARKQKVKEPKPEVNIGDEVEDDWYGDDI
ncbi:hypothetical protein POSPLADRAFT_1165650 [Postia placenta MAD-698-R-SB12]|uniref:UvrD-like helicase ATP-binding domain-containing protein n=1 Tax=Postia placenta MAD-698-R-SB12 TaxID=670580 RepID=A0A1X6NHU2_9APHY|nr:hypothetical protein POSPLADRAFT_1165650 [Postia placenta MAD-698-R-SB12]OSX68102.1 hypothetical protein POSPLADRAFT_1165650 [Postia placenta MAD-698-R-SB12]